MVLRCTRGPPRSPRRRARWALPRLRLGVAGAVLLGLAGCPAAPALYHRHLDRPYPTKVPQSVRLADLDGNGHLAPEVALLSKGAAVLENQGNGRFAVPSSGGRVAPCTGCSALVVGDFTGAGKNDDLLGLRQGTRGPELVGLLGQASGTFVDQAAPAPPAGDVISVLAAGDLDDAVVAGKGFLGVYLRTSGGFDPLRLHPVAGLDPVSLAGGDLDGDGFDDLVLITQGTCCPPAGAGLQVFFGGPFGGNAGQLTLTSP